MVVNIKILIQFIINNYIKTIIILIIVINICKVNKKYSAIVLKFGFIFGKKAYFRLMSSGDTLLP